MVGLLAGDGDDARGWALLCGWGVLGELLMADHQDRSGLYIHLVGVTIIVTLLDASYVCTCEFFSRAVHEHLIQTILNRASVQYFQSSPIWTFVLTVHCSQDS
jgi:hypothetical protein